MISRWTATLTALAVAVAGAAAPTQAFARDYRYHHYYHHYDHGDAVAAGVVGLVLGAALGAALSEPSRPRCYDGCRYGPPPGYYGPPPSYRGSPDQPPPDYYDGGKGQSSNYAPDDRRADYERDYGTPPPPDGDQCLRQTQHWDPYSGRYVWVNVRTC